MATKQASPLPSQDSAKKRRPRLWRRMWRSRVFRAVLIGFVAFALWLTWSIYPYLTAPGNDSLSARLAEWARDHGLGRVVVTMEKWQYDLFPPKVGGTPSAIPPPAATAPSPHAHGHSAQSNHPTPQVAIRPRIPPIAQPAVPNEGLWHTLVDVKGQPAVQAAYLRPDATHTSYLTGVVWMDQKLLSFHLHPGYEEPGGSWPVPDWVPPGKRRGLVATWNGAFKLADARGGFYLDGHTAGTLVNGAASEVFYRNGSMTVGSWNHEVHMSPDVVGVRQNLGMLINHGKIASNIDSNPEFNWGLTLGGAYYIFRSGVGITAQGDLVYASGDALSAFTLARVLKRAGCVRAMELDINPAWISFMSYQAGHHPNNPTPQLLLHDYQRPANRYYTHTSRDFVTVYGR